VTCRTTPGTATRAPHAATSWHTAVQRRQAETPDDLDGWQRTRPSAGGQKQDLVRRNEISRRLAALDQHTRAVLLLEQGYDQTETTARLGTTRKSVEMSVRRHRERHAQQHKGQRHGEAS
jgi:hypothetical protein